MQNRVIVNEKDYDYKIALENQYADDILSFANDLLGAYKNTSDPELKVKITKALLRTDDDQFTFLHWAAHLDKGEIIETTIDALKDEYKYFLIYLLNRKNDKGFTVMDMMPNINYPR